MITPVLLCGGSGTRLWPLSRKSYPKQFSPLMGPESLFQSSAKRLSGSNLAAPLVVTTDAFRFIAVQQMADVGVQPQEVIIEPEGRDTAPAILAAALQVAKTDEEGLMLVAPSDHAIPDTDGFRQTIDIAAEAARKGQIVTFGILPDHAETAYGYLELDGPVGTEPEPRPLKSFVEKPDHARATEMLETGRFLWNAGIFLFRAKTIIAAFRDHAPDVLDPVQHAVDGAATDLGFLRLAAEPWAQAPAISIDYAVMEKAQNLSVVPFHGKWSDLGDWAAVWRETEVDGLALSGAATAMECQNSLLRSEVPDQAVVGIGLQDIMAVAMPDAVLIAHKSRAQEVKRAVERLKTAKAPQAEQLPRDHRPWGWFESLALGDRFQVKRIVVHPGAALSLQSHHHRAEHWIVVEGTAQVTVDDKVQLVTENQSIYVPLGAIHRLENPGKVPMILIEVQTGTYLGEDDIQRYEDVYDRS